MSLESAIWADHEITPEHGLFVAYVEKQMTTYVEQGRLPVWVEKEILQKIEIDKRKFLSAEDAQERAKYFFEMVVMPIVYYFDKIREEEALVAIAQGEYLLKKDEFSKKFGQESSYVKELDYLIGEIDEFSKKFEEERDNVLSH